MDVDGFIRAEGRADLEVHRFIGSQFLMPFQIVNGIIRGADVIHLGLANQAPHGHIRVMLQHIVGFVPDRFHIALGKWLSHAEIFMQLQIAPVIHGIADSHFQRFCKGTELFIGIRPAGNHVLRYTVRAHHPPFIMISEISAIRIAPAQPNLRDIVKAAVFKNLFG